MNKIIVIFFTFLLGIAECVAQQKIVSYTQWSIPDSQTIIADAQRASIQQQESRTAPPIDMEEIPLLQFDESMFGWQNTTRYNFWQKPYSASVYINRKTGEDVTYSLQMGQYTPLSVGWSIDGVSRKERQQHIFSQLPSDSVFVINSLPRVVGEVWGCVDEGALRLHHNNAVYHSFRECAEAIYGSVEKFVSVLQQSRQDKLTENIKNTCLLNRFNTEAEAKEFLRSDYSFFATAFPDKKPETLRRFIALLSQHTTLSNEELNAMKHNQDAICITACIYEHPLRRAEFKRIFNRIFDEQRGGVMLNIVAQNDALIEDAQARLLYDHYAGAIRTASRQTKAICIYLIYGVKIQIPRYEKIIG